MNTYQFLVTLAEGTEHTDDLAEAVYGGGCDDGALFSTGGVVQVGFDRKAESLETAIRTAVADLERAGCRVASVQIQREAIPAGAAKGPA
jgi:hypothetical protein